MSDTERCLTHGQWQTDEHKECPMCKKEQACFRLMARRLDMTQEDVQSAIRFAMRMDPWGL